ncbi:isoprenyl transferase [Gimibacter soli]|uniref:Isoprenyl transferase n=1 Tax=Gimibacter soli TaxID=3024400 RepID=A0AAE9XRK9_9PROT|nr:isoprenyl transferase [Gimibacter soli]WCL52610.1 isoprenyl transferase [Gimibacter soli]
MPPAPTHVAIIMDGNGRWAASRGLPRAAGHRKGADAVRAAVRGAGIQGVRYLTLYAFSSENWNRPADEVMDLMGLLRTYLSREIKSLHKEGVRLRIIGRRDRLAADINKMIDDAEHMTRDNDRLTLVIALSYGSRDEIVRAARALATAVVEGRESLENLNEERFAQELSTHDIPDPDLIIRTSGEQRLSNFLLWQAAYSEFLFMDIYWPDFDENTFAEAVSAYHGRDRRFGARP